MRRVLSLLMVVLLVLRGLLGDAMAMGSMPAMEAAHAPVVTTASGHHHGMEHGTAEAPPPAAHAHTAHGSPQAAHAEVVDQAVPLAVAQTDACAASDSSAACDGHAQGAHCTLCDICHSAFTHASLLSTMGDMAAPAPVVVPTVLFASAQPLQASKPPIF